VNFLCISSYNNNLDWLKNYENPHLIYDKTWNGGYKDNKYKLKVPKSNLKKKYPNFNIINADNNGYNVNDYLTFIIEFYGELPDNIVFMKGNTIGRHVSEDKFKRLVKNKFFTCIEECESHNPHQKSLKNGFAMITCDGGWMEKNNSWYLKHHAHPVKYFLSYNDFLNFCFDNPVLPKYIRFAPGGCYIVPKEQILKYDLIFYKNLKLFAEHSRVSGEGQLIERALYTIWNCDFEVSSNMKKRINKKTFNYPSAKKILFFNYSSRIKDFLSKLIK